MGVSSSSLIEIQEGPLLCCYSQCNNNMHPLPAKYLCPFCRMSGYCCVKCMVCDKVNHANNHCKKIFKVSNKI